MDPDGDIDEPAEIVELRTHRAHRIVRKANTHVVRFFLRVNDRSGLRPNVSNDVEFVDVPRTVHTGRTAVFLDVAGNRWDLLGLWEL